MFDGDSKIFLALGAAVVWFAMVGADNSGPVAAPETDVASEALPPMPVAIAADGAPAQTGIRAATVPLGDGFEAELLHGYRLEGLVVSRMAFRNDPTSAVSPLDLGIVWGDLADPEQVADFNFRAGPRVLHVRPGENAAFDDRLETMITNNHLIPASPDVHAALMAVEPGQRIRLSGYLVEVRGDEIRPWRSSTRRDDSTIIGGCEIILVREVEVLQPDQAA